MKKDAGELRTRGTGSVSRKKKNAKLLRNWYYAYYDLNHRQIQESSGSPLKSVAERALRRKLEEVERGVPVAESRRLKYEEAKELLLTDYMNNHIGLIERRDGDIYGIEYLDEFFGNMLVKNINTPLLKKFVSKLQSGELQKKVRKNENAKGASNATISRVLALLRRMMNIARLEAAT